MNTYTIKVPSDIFSLVISVYGTLEESVKLVSDNSALIPSFNSDISTLAGEVVSYDNTLVKTSLPPTSVLATPPPAKTQYIWTGRDGQNTFDVCLQTYGILDNQVKLMTDNSVDFTSPIFAQVFNYNSSMIASSTVWNRSTGMGVVFSSGN
jgi:hypothetical protein